MKEKELAYLNQIIAEQLPGTDLYDAAWAIRTEILLAGVPATEIRWLPAEEKRDAA